MEKTNVYEVIKELLNKMEDQKDIKQVKKPLMEGHLNNGNKVMINILIERI